MKSFLFQIWLFYFRFLPLQIFWGLCPAIVFQNQQKHPRLFASAVFLFLFFAYLIASLLFLIFPVTIINFLIFWTGGKNLVAAVFLFPPEEDSQTQKQEKERDSNFQFLLSPLVNSPVSKVFFRLLEIFSLILLGISSVELFNDLFSHHNPDIFDFLVPNFGGEMFWGGASLFSLTSFFLYFAGAVFDLRVWKRRRQKVGSSDFWQKMLFSASLLHPYYFLSPKGRKKLRHQKVRIDLQKLLCRAYRKNLSWIPEEWIVENGPFK